MHVTKKKRINIWKTTFILKLSGAKHMNTLPKMAGGKKYVKYVANDNEKILGGGVAISCRGKAKIVDLI